MKHLHKWVITYNNYKNLYEAAPRDCKDELWSGDGGNILRSSSVLILIQLIEKTNGDKDLIKELLKTI